MQDGRERIHSPHLGTIDNPFVALFCRLSFDARDVGARSRLGLLLIAA